MSQTSTVCQEIQFRPGLKTKEKLLSSLERAGSNSKRKKLRDGEFENMDKAVHLWFVAKRS